MINSIEIAAAVFGLIQGVLVMFNKRSNWIVYVIQMVLLLIFSLYSKLYGDTVNNIIYIIWGIIGFFLWGKPERTITSASAKERIIYIAVIAVGTAAGFFILSRTDDALPFIDAFTTVSSFVATYYMVTRKIDTWFIWFVNDIAYVIEYFLLPRQAIYLMVLNIIWTVLAVTSYISWKKLMDRQKT